MFSNPRQVAPPGIEPGTYRTISESLYQCVTLPPFYYLQSCSFGTRFAVAVFNHPGILLDIDQSVMSKIVTNIGDLAVYEKVALTLMLSPLNAFINRSPALLPMDLTLTQRILGAN